MGYAPTPGPDGLRLYGHGLEIRKENVSRCVQSVADDNTRCPSFFQCSRKRGHGPGRLYCRQHDPDARKARDDADRKACATEESRQDSIRREGLRIAKALGVEGEAEYHVGLRGGHGYRERLVIGFDDARRLVKRIEERLCRS